MIIHKRGFIIKFLIVYVIYLFQVELDNYSFSSKLLGTGNCEELKLAIKHQIQTPFL